MKEHLCMQMLLLLRLKGLKALIESCHTYLYSVDLFHCTGRQASAALLTVIVVGGVGNFPTLNVFHVNLGASLNLSRDFQPRYRSVLSE
jgi:hypothetical protein